MLITQWSGHYLYKNARERDAESFKLYFDNQGLPSELRMLIVEDMLYVRIGSLCIPVPRADLSGEVSDIRL